MIYEFKLPLLSCTLNIYSVVDGVEGKLTCMNVYRKAVFASITVKAYITYRGNEYGFRVKTINKWIGSRKKVVIPIRFKGYAWRTYVTYVKYVGEPLEKNIPGSISGLLYKPFFIPSRLVLVKEDRRVRVDVFGYVRAFERISELIPLDAVDEVKLVVTASVTPSGQAFPAKGEKEFVFEIEKRGVPGTVQVPVKFCGVDGCVKYIATYNLVDSHWVLTGVRRGARVEVAKALALALIGYAALTYIVKLAGRARG